MHSVVMVFALLTAGASTGCRRGAGAPPRHVVMLCDRSGSGTCDEALVAQAARSFLASNPPLGSRFEALEIGADLDDVRRLHLVQLPAAWGAGTKGKHKRFVAEELARLGKLKFPPRTCGSAVAVAIWKAARTLRERGSREQELWVASDLRECSVLANFERAPLQPDKFVAALRKAKLLPDLAGVRLAVCGVHDRSAGGFPAWTPEKSQLLHAAWASAFQAMKAPGPVALEESCDWHLPAPRAEGPTMQASAGGGP